MPHDPAASARPTSAPRLTRGERQEFALLLAMYWVLLYPILRADRYYIDDLKRSLMGRTGWDSNGRWLTTLLMKLLQCYDHALVDISPFPQIAAIGVLACAGVLIKRRYAIRSPLVAALVAFPLGAQPFFLENLSYKFDALSMALALLLAMLPVIGMRTDRRGAWLGTLSLFGSLALYQPAINAFLVFALFEWLDAQSNAVPPGALLRRSGLRVAQFAIATAAYEALIGIHIHGWVAAHSRIPVDVSKEGVLLRNAMRFLDFIVGSFNVHWWLYCAPLLIVLAVAAILPGVRYAAGQWRRGARWSAALFLATAVILPAVAMGCVGGPMLLASDPLLMPRVLVAVGPLLATGLLALRAGLIAGGRPERWTIGAALPCALGMCVVASAYGNAAAGQKDYEDRIAAEFALKVQEHDVVHPVASFLVDGNAGRAPVTGHVVDQLPLVGELVRPYIDGSDNFVTRNFLRFYLPELVRSNTLYPDSPAGAAMLDQTCRRQPAYANDRFDVFFIDTTAALSFNDARMHRCNGQALIPASR